jgi:hypothetical protein
VKQERSRKQGKRNILELNTYDNGLVHLNVWRATIIRMVTSPRSASVFAER